MVKPPRKTPKKRAAEPAPKAAPKAVKPEPAQGVAPEPASGGTTPILKPATVEKPPSPEPAGNPKPTEKTAPAAVDVLKSATVQATSKPAEKTRAHAPEAKRGGVVMPLLGGVLAAAIGAGAVLYLLPDGWTGQTDALDAQTVRINDIQGGLDALRADFPADPSAALASVGDEIAALASASDDLQARVDAAVADQTAAFAALQTQVEDTQAGQDGLTGRVGALEARPVDQAPDIAALQADVRALTDRLETAAQEARDQIAAANARAAEVEQSVAAEAVDQSTRAALSRLSDDIDNGAGYAEALSELEKAAPGVEVAAVLAENAETGVSSLRNLRADFPDAARDALAATVADQATDGSVTGRLAAFVRAQTGARSLSPREGDDPDAILSRAEAALAASDISGALSEVQALPPDAAAAMQDWTARAQTRQDVLAALADLSAQKSSN